MHHHQVGVHRSRSDPSDLVDDGEAERNVGDERAVHHVEMDDVAAAVDKLDVLLQMEKVRRQDRGGNL